MVLLVVSVVMLVATIGMIVEAFRRSDSQLVGASSMCAIASTLLLWFAVASLKVNARLDRQEEHDDGRI